VKDRAVAAAPAPSPLRGPSPVSRGRPRRLVGDPGEDAEGVVVRRVVAEAVEVGAGAVELHIGVYCTPTRMLKRGPTANGPAP